MDTTTIELPSILSKRSSMEYRKHTTTEQLRHFWACLKVLCHSLCETRMYRTVEAVDQYFIRGLEGARIDCALSTIPLGSTKDRLNLLLHESMEGKHFIPIEIKHVAPYLHCREQTVKWSCSFSAKQWKACQAVIIGSVIEPRYVAVIPMEYIRQKAPDSKRRKLESLGVQSARMLLAPTAFAPEWIPFVLPLSQLPTALGVIRHYADGTTDHW